jgi:signal transduction histidine kinase
MVEFVEQMIHAVRRIATELRPSVLDQLGLLDTLEWQMQDFQKRTGVACTCEIESEDCDLDPQRSTEVFRMVQEALTNVARHAHAHRVDLYASTVADRLIVEIRDDGVGMRPADANGHGSLGLVGMRERAARCGGSVRVESSPGHGTTVRIQVPLGDSAAKGGAR